MFRRCQNRCIPNNNALEICQNNGWIVKENCQEVCENKQCIIKTKPVMTFNSSPLAIISSGSRTVSLNYKLKDQAIPGRPLSLSVTASNCFTANTTNLSTDSTGKGSFTVTASKVSNYCKGEIVINATGFNQNLSGWSIKGIQSTDKIQNMFYNTALSQENYCKLAKNSSWQKYIYDLGFTTYYVCP